MLVWVIYNDDNKLTAIDCNDLHGVRAVLLSVQGLHSL